MTHSTRYCAQCGTPLVSGLIQGRERQHCLNCGLVLYRNPIPVAIMVAQRDGELLLVKRTQDPLRGFWAPPSGYVESDETTEETALREAREETGFEVRVDQVLGVYSRANTGILFVAYAGQVTGGEILLSEETEQIGFFAPGALPAQPQTPLGAVLDEFFLDVIGQVLSEVAQRLQSRLGLADTRRHPFRV